MTGLIEARGHERFARYYEKMMEWIGDDDNFDGYTLAQYMMGAMVVGMASKDSIMDAISDIEDKVDMELSEDEIVEEN
jgi:hypothetical protein